MCNRMCVCDLHLYIWSGNRKYVGFSWCCWRHLLIDSAWSWNAVLSLVAQTVKRLPTMRETRVQSLGQEDPLRRKWQPTPVLLPGKSHGWRSVVGHSPWGLKESDTTERLHFHLSLSWYITSFSKDGFKTWCLVKIVLRPSIAFHQILQSNNMLPNV